MDAGAMKAFVEALMDPARAPPAGLITANGSDPAQRFAVYRNNVIVSLIEALAAKFPRTRDCAGPENFRAIARVFAAMSPPRSRLMAEYGEDFPEFIAAFPPAQETPWLADVARLEAARVRAYHAADARALDGVAFATLDPETLAGLAFSIHPSVRLLSSPYAAVSLWIGDAVDPQQPEDALVLRPELDVHVIRLGPGVADFLGALIDGESLGAAALTAMATSADFDPPHALHVLSTSRMVTSFHISQEPFDDHEPV